MIYTTLHYTTLHYTTQKTKNQKQFVITLDEVSEMLGKTTNLPQVTDSSHQALIHLTSQH